MGESSRYIGKHEINTIGKTKSLSFTDTPARLKLLDDPTKEGPATFIIHVEQAAYLRHGGSAVDATSNGFKLLKDGYAKVTVRDERTNYISALRVSANGTLRATHNSSEDPGTGDDEAP